MTKKEAQDRFLWIGNESVRRSSVSDVSINRIKGGKSKANGNEYRFSFTFRNDCSKKLGDKGDKIEIAIFKNRIMFRQSENGMTLSGKSNKTSNRYMHFPITSLTEELTSFIGDYELKYDDFYEVYYVEKEV